MKYPMINKQPRREVNIPQLSGGLNLRDSLTGIRDNQMTDCVNMWYKDGMLKTRPAVQKTNWHLQIGNGNSKVKVFDDIVYNERALIGVSYIDEDGKLIIFFYWQGKCDTNYIVAGNVSSAKREYSATDEAGYFVIEKDGTLYCYTDKFKIFKREVGIGNVTWKNVSNEEIYVPTVLTHAKATNNGLSYKGVMFEGYNLLTDSYKMIYSTVNLEDVEDGVTWMRYPYVSKLPSGVDTTVIAKLTTKNGIVCEHKAIWTGGKEVRCFEETDSETEDGLYLYITASHVHFVTEQGTNKIATIEKEDFVEDNLEIKVIYSSKPDAERLSKVFKMTKSIWFGGTANGINSGSRLFLCGNTDDKEKSLVLWSALNNPLYFNENNYIYVGNRSERTTCFGKQGENLIIFKPSEIYYSYYAQNANITADDLINQSVVDYEANSVCFPIVALHSSVGCDCPDTVQLCRNRLVWLNSDGKVYTLVSSNQYSEMTVYCVSGMVDKKIKKYDAERLMTATSHDFDGHYLLMVGKDIFVMDYNSYGYTHIYGYSKNEDANVLIPWYFWKLNVNGNNVKFFGFKDFIFSFYDDTQDTTGRFTGCVLCNEKNNNFIQEKITCGFTTKLYDFFAAGYLKNIDRISIGFGNNGGELISVNFVTNVGNEGEDIIITNSAMDERDEGFITVKSFYPSVRSVRTMGVKVECEGQLCIDGLSIQYTLLGRVK